MTQLELDLPIPPPRDYVAAAHAFLDGLLEHRCCRDCGRGVDEVWLLFVHRERRRRDVQVRRLAALGVARGRLVDELAICDVTCRRCLLGRSNRRAPAAVRKMLRAPARPLGRRSGEAGKPGIRIRELGISA